MNQQTKTDPPQGTPPDGGDVASSQAGDAVAGMGIASASSTGGGNPAASSKGDHGPAVPESISQFHAAKLDERRYHWVMEWRLVGYTALALAVLVVLSVASYAYHSSQTPVTLLSRADLAAADGNLDEEVRWLNTYLLMRPDDQQVFVRAALTADRSAESGTRNQLAKRIPEARKRLAMALAFLPDTDANREMREDLRHRLIERQLQLGGYEYKDVERQVIVLDPRRDNPQAHRWMAQALLGQVRELIYQIRPRQRHDETTEYWSWLADQPPGLVVLEALRHAPDDLELAANVFGLLASSPEHFGVGVEGGSESVDDFRQTLAALDEQSTETIQQVLTELQQRNDSRARILLYRYAMLLGNADQAQTVITEAATDATPRLSELLTDAEDDAANDGGDNSEGEESQDWRLTEREREAVADYEAVYLAAQSLANRVRGNPDDASEEGIAQARQWLSLLRDLGTDRVRVAPGAVRNVFVTSGTLEQLLGETDSAIAIWTAGLEVLSNGDLDLRGSIAWALGETAESPEERERAEKAVEEFEALVDVKGKELIEMPSSQASPAQRASIADQIENARWRAKICRAQLLATGPRSAEADRKIIEALRGVTSRDLQLNEGVVLTGVGLLTRAYQRRSAWDLAAEVLEAASQTFPENHALLEASGNAWTRAGNRAQAQKQWQRARLSNNPQTRVAVLEAEFANQLRLIPKDREIDSLRSQVRALRDLLATSPGSFRQEKLRLELLQAQLPPENSDAALEQYLRSAELAERVVEIADANPTEINLQTYAAERLAASGQVDQASRIAERLRQNQQFNADQQVMLQTRLLSAAQKHGQAATGLLDYIRDQDEVSIELVLQAAEAASRANDNALLEQALLLVPDARRSPYIWFQLYQAALAQSDVAKADQYLNQLHAVEGYGNPEASEQKPAYSWFVEARQLASKLLARGSVQWDDSELRKAERLVQQLQSARPHWGSALSLRGWLAYASGNRRSAIDLLQQGIAAGDTQMRTRQLLWQALIAEGRDEEAQQQIQHASMAAQMDVDPYDEVAIGLDLRRGRYAQAIQSAKQVAMENPEDPIAQLVYAKFALSTYDQLAAGRNAAADTSIDRDELLDSAKQAIEKAEKSAKKTSDQFAVVSARLQMLIGLKDEDGIRAELEALTKSKLPPADRLLLQAKANVALGEVDQAIKNLEASNEQRPNFRVQTILVRLLRSRGRGQESLEVLRQAFRQDPTNPVLRTELATQMAASGESINWDEIAKLLSDDQAATSQNRFVYALLLATRGSETQRKEAVRLLRSLSGTRAEMALDAARVQAALMLELANDSKSLSDGDREGYRQEARRIFQRLATGETPLVVDLTRYCMFLIRSGAAEDLGQAQELLTKLKSMPNGAIEVLKIELFLARESGQSESIPEVVQDWAKDPLMAEQSKAKGAVETAAGDALLQSGFIDEGIDWFQRAYEANEDTFVAYVLALSRVGRFDQAADVSAAHFRKSDNANAAVLLVEALLADSSGAGIRKHRAVVEAAIVKFPENQSLLESVGTLEMQVGNKDRAIGLYQKILKADPHRIRTLNNLAMALAETPGRAIEGLQPIDQAIRFAGENVELLDTKGTVLLRAGKLPEAKAVFETTIEKSEGKEPRFVFHLVQTLLEMGDEADARTLWRTMDLDKLNPKGLTPVEQEVLKDMMKRFGTPASDAASEKKQI